MKSRSEGSKSGEKKKLKFPYLLFVEDESIDYFTAKNNRILEDIKKETDIEQIEFDSRLKIPDLKGSILKIFDKDQKYKTKALQRVLEELLKLKKNKGKRYDSDSKKENEIATINLVPEGLVSLLIGSKGKQIGHIMNDSRTDIVVIQPINKMPYRCVKIEGQVPNLLIAYENINKTLEERSIHVDEIEKVPKPVEMARMTVPLLLIKAKFGVDKKAVGFLIGKDGSFTKKLCDENSVSIKISDDEDVRCLGRDESCCVLIWFYDS